MLTSIGTSIADISGTRSRPRLEHTPTHIFYIYFMYVSICVFFYCFFRTNECKDFSLHFFYYLSVSQSYLPVYQHNPPILWYEVWYRYVNSLFITVDMINFIYYELHHREKRKKQRIWKIIFTWPLMRLRSCLSNQCSIYFFLSLLIIYSTLIQVRPRCVSKRITIPWNRKSIFDVDQNLIYLQHNLEIPQPRFDP